MSPIGTASNQSRRLKNRARGTTFDTTLTTPPHTMPVIERTLCHKTTALMNSRPRPSFRISRISFFKSVIMRSTWSRSARPRNQRKAPKMRSVSGSLGVASLEELALSTFQAIRNSSKTIDIPPADARASIECSATLNAHSQPPDSGCLVCQIKNAPMLTPTIKSESTTLRDFTPSPPVRLSFPSLFADSAALCNRRRSA